MDGLGSVRFGNDGKADDFYHTYGIPGQAAVIEALVSRRCRIRVNGQSIS